MTSSRSLYQRLASRRQQEGFKGVGLAGCRILFPAFSCRSLARRIRGLAPELSSLELLDFAYSAFAGLIRPGQVRSEFTAYLGRGFGKPAPRAVMEIGTANGGTLFLHARLAALDACVISLDLPGGEFGGGYAPHRTPLYQSFGLAKQDLHLLRADSHVSGTLTQVRDVLKGRMLDVLFIDGDHTYDGVKKDFDMYAPLVRPGGMVAFHDIVAYPAEPRNEVFRYWSDFKRQHEPGSIMEFVENPRQLGFGIGAWSVQ